MTVEITSTKTVHWMLGLVRGTKKPQSKVSERYDFPKPLCPVTGRISKRDNLKGNFPQLHNIFKYPTLYILPPNKIYS